MHIMIQVRLVYVRLKASSSFPCFPPFILRHARIIRRRRIPSQQVLVLSISWFGGGGGHGTADRRALPDFGECWALPSPPAIYGRLVLELVWHPLCLGSVQSIEKICPSGEGTIPTDSWKS